MAIKIKDPQKALRDTYWQGRRPAPDQVHNPVKEGARTFWSYAKILLPIVLFGAIMWFLYTYGPELGFIDR